MTELEDRKRTQQPSVANLVKRISQDLQGKANAMPQTSDVIYRKGAPELRHKHAKAMFSYSPDNDDELSLEKDDLIEVLGEEEEGWWRGRLLKSTKENSGLKEGVFPSNFVKLIDEPVGETVGKDEDKKKHTDSASESGQQEMIQPKKIQGVGFGNIFAGENKIELRHKSGDSKTIDVVNKDSSAKHLLNGRKQPDSKAQEYALVTFPYEAENDDELTLKEGEIIVIVSKTCEDPGWWRGELNGKEGVFPDNFVDLLSAEEAEKHRKSSTSAAPPSVPAKPVKLVGQVRPVSPSGADQPPSGSAAVKPERPPLPEQLHKPSLVKVGSPATPSPAAATAAASVSRPPPPSTTPGRPTAVVDAAKEKSPTEVEKCVDAKSITPKKSYSSPLSALTSALGKTKPPLNTNIDDKLAHKVVDSNEKERDAIAPLDAERLTHPTALRPRNLNKRPPSQAFLKDIMASESAALANSQPADVVDSINSGSFQALSGSDRKLEDVRKMPEYVTRAEYDKLRQEFDVFKRECHEKLKSLEKFLASLSAAK